MKYICSCSFGKDSLCMLLKLIEENYPLDEVVFFDTGKEFQAIYSMRDKVLPLLAERGIKYIELKPHKSFDWNCYERPIKNKETKQVHKIGYGWCGGSNQGRWMTAMKVGAIKSYFKSIKDEITQYVGIAYDEPKRIPEMRVQGKLYPLFDDWKMTEKQCLEYCYRGGYYWEEDGVRLYDVLDRVSCWCCKNKNLKELYGMYKYLPKYWQKIKDMQSRLIEPMKGEGKSVFDLEKRFENKDKQLTLF